MRVPAFHFAIRLSDKLQENLKSLQTFEVGGAESAMLDVRPKYEQAVSAREALPRHPRLLCSDVCESCPFLTTRLGIHFDLVFPGFQSGEHHQHISELVYAMSRRKTAQETDAER